ncbi:MAG: phosphotransferase family protein [Actinomycetota bacterium]
MEDRAPTPAGAPGPLVDTDALSRYLDDRMPGTGPFEVERHRAGHSNETFFLRRSGLEWVLRRPPRGAFLPTAHDVLREHRVLAALAETPVRAPRPLVACQDPGVIGAPFYVMERAGGVVIRDRLPGYLEEDRGARARLGQEMVDALVELHSVEWREMGLEGWGRPSGYLERQLRRWSGQLELTMPLTRPVPALVRVGEWLRAHLPRSGSSTIVHGDYKVDNVVFSPEPPARLMAILDWEMSTIGDPLADLGWLISFWHEPGEEVDESFEGFAPTRSPGFHSRDQLIDRYARASGRDVEDLDFYHVLATWKLAILLEGSYARHLAGVTDDPFFAKMEDGVPRLARRALEVAGVAP